MKLTNLPYAERAKLDKETGLTLRRIIRLLRMAGYERDRPHQDAGLYVWEFRNGTAKVVRIKGWMSEGELLCMRPTTILSFEDSTRKGASWTLDPVDATLAEHNRLRRLIIDRLMEMVHGEHSRQWRTSRSHPAPRLIKKG